MEIKIFNTPFSFLVDTGAAILLISEATWKDLPPECCKLEQWTHQALTGVEGSPLHVLGAAAIQIEIGSQHFNIVVGVVKGIAVQAILGLDFLNTY